VGKTALRIAQTISLAIGRELTGQYVFKRCRVLYLCFEDGRDELRRRIAACCMHHGVDPTELKGWFFYAAPKAIKLAELENGSPKRGDLERQLRDKIRELEPDLVCVDPFVKTHSLEENNSGQMDFVCELLTKFAEQYNIAVDAPHHSHKGIATPGDADMGRGSSSIRDAGRLVLLPSRML
jgi:RecA-family ATPase